MIPLGDASRRPSKFPIITTLIITANALVFLMELAYIGEFLFGALTARVFESRTRRWRRESDL